MDIDVELGTYRNGYRHHLGNETVVEEPGETRRRSGAEYETAKGHFFTGRKRLLRPHQLDF